MIQRIQSLYLLAAALFVLAFVFLGDVWRTSVGGLFPWVGPVTLALGLATTLAALGAVFLYKDRRRQRTVILVAQWLDLVLVLLLVGVMVALNLGEYEGWGMASQTAYITALLPFAAYVFLRLARRGVEKDIALVKSMDRLR